MGGLLLYTQARWVWKTSNVQCFLRRNWKVRHVWNELFYFTLLTYLSDTEITHNYLSDCSPPISLIHLQTYTHSFSLSFPLLNLTSNWTQFWPYIYCFLLQLLGTILYPQLLFSLLAYRDSFLWTPSTL